MSTAAGRQEYICLLCYESGLSEGKDSLRDRARERERLEKDLRLRSAPGFQLTAYSLKEWKAHSLF